MRFAPFLLMLGALALAPFASAARDSGVYMILGATQPSAEAPEGAASAEQDDSMPTVALGYQFNSLFAIELSQAGGAGELSGGSHADRCTADVECQTVVSHGLAILSFPLGPTITLDVMGGSSKWEAEREAERFDITPEESDVQGYGITVAGERFGFMARVLQPVEADDDSGDLVTLGLRINF